MTEKYRGSINPEDRGESSQDQPIDLAEEPVNLLPRPHILRGYTYREPSPVGTAFITINKDSEGLTRELFIRVGRAGSDVASDAEALGRMISLALSIPTQMSNRAILAGIIDQLSGIGGSETIGFGYSRIRSLSDAVARALTEDFNKLPEDVTADETPKTAKAEFLNDSCPSCGYSSLVSEEGCIKCFGCGFSSC